MLFQICLLWALLCPQEPRTLPEITQWIADKLPELAVYSGKSPEASRSFKVIRAQFDGCNFSFESRHEVTFDLQTVYVDRWEIPLGALDPSAFKVSAAPIDGLKPAMWDLRLVARADRKALHMTQSEQIGKDYRQRGKALLGYTILSFDSKDSAVRMQSAFAQAVKHCAEK